MVETPWDNSYNMPNYKKKIYRKKQHY
ncbi:unnamed protein product [Nezara viridula]|uniref:Uncharacterized protein n=1 Tax=Nezara viridula TaxID=85310 RepID=A0A9P0HGV4_NEZVI|nr:unnamed protein product [Nezara viridula]